MMTSSAFLKAPPVEMRNELCAPSNCAEPVENEKHKKEVVF